jgi:uncharacterized protein YjbI with pentapeptide repeats
MGSFTTAIFVFPAARNSRQCDVDFTGADLTGAVLSGEFTDCDFCGADLTNAILSGSFSECDF